MFGFVVAGASLVGLIMLARSRRYRGGPHFLFRSLHTSPGQEKLIRDAFAEGRELTSEFFRARRAAKAELGPLMEAEKLDKDALNRWAETQEQAFAQLRGQLVELADRVHGVLDAEQRRQVAGFLTRSGPFWMHRHGCGHHHHHHYRHAHCC
jgi:Heavy-metal resistance